MPKDVDTMGDHLDTGSKEMSGFSAMEKKIFQHDSTGSNFFHEGLNTCKLDNGQAEATLKAWANFESYA